MPAEQWRPVPGWPAYRVSDLGRIWSIERDIVDRLGRRRHQPGAFLTPTVDPDGRHKVTLRDGIDRKLTTRVHRQVLLAFVGEPPPKTEGCHRNGDLDDNRLSNLYWGTRTENRLDSVRHGTHHEARRDRCVREHLLQAPNLVAHRHDRQCLACERARKINTYRRSVGRPLVDVRTYADEQYTIIMGGVAA